MHAFTKSALCSLRESPKALATLREKLFLLWGDLEERKSRASTTLKQIDGNAESPQKGEAPKSKPFHCCLKEYGVKKRMQRNVEIGDRERDDGCDDEGEDWVWERRWKMFGTTII